TAAPSLWATRSGPRARASPGICSTSFGRAVKNSVSAPPASLAARESTWSSRPCNAGDPRSARGREAGGASARFPVCTMVEPLRLDSRSDPWQSWQALSSLQGVRYMERGAVDRENLIHNSNRSGNAPRKFGNFDLFDESLRDGLQSPSVIDPPVEDKIRIVELM